MDYEIVYQAKLNNQNHGDAYFISQNSPWLMVVADGLGSGDKARDAANIAVSLARNYCLSSNSAPLKRDIFPDFLIQCHQKLKRTRGAAVAGVVLDAEAEALTFCGVGNIRLFLAGARGKTLCSQPGIVGVQMPKRISVNKIPLESYATGFLFSDGISLRSVLRAADTPYRPLKILADEIQMLNGNSDDRTLIVFSINDLG